MARRRRRRRSSGGEALLALVAAMLAVAAVAWLLGYALVLVALLGRAEQPCGRTGPGACGGESPLSSSDKGGCMRRRSWRRPT
jgi:hypothetical protein